jgi:hypothetical protein
LDARTKLMGSVRSYLFDRRDELDAALPVEGAAEKTDIGGGREAWRQLARYPESDHRYIAGGADTAWFSGRRRAIEWLKKS